MDAIKVFNNVAHGVKNVKTILSVFDGIDKSIKEQKKKILKPRSIMDICILQTILEKVAKSQNEELIKDFEQHEITVRLEKVALLIIQYEARDGKNLSKKEKQRLGYVVEEIECIYDHSKALMLANVLDVTGSFKL
ncbi:hypothetical protein CRE_02647 [Caenorhabditis remanei]|uniref:Uncharacterized protein n=2 Tax=Caenorhabditis remanei TaxID=31234 RepID=E3NG32_CAERE|nr:hypothetical protein CRE_02647 [Caenorhabditis remanei]